MRAIYCECFEKVYDVHVTGADRSRILAQLKQGWLGAGGSYRQYLAGIVASYETIQAAPCEIRPYLFQVQRRDVARALDLAQLLNVVRSVVEAAKPGATAVPADPKTLHVGRLRRSLNAQAKLAEMVKKHSDKL